MSFLHNLSPEDREMLISLPYRVGYWISQSDTSGGDDSDEEELQALSNILNGYAGEIFVCETVQVIISNTVRAQEQWPKWRENVGDVPEDCKRAIYILTQAVDEKEVNAFKQHIMEVGEAVALAFRELEDHSFIAQMKLKMEYRKLESAAKKRGVHYKTFEEFLNISPAERIALEWLAKALNINYAI